MHIHFTPVTLYTLRIQLTSRSQPGGACFIDDERPRHQKICYKKHVRRFEPTVGIDLHLRRIEQSSARTLNLARTKEKKTCASASKENRRHGPPGKPRSPDVRVKRGIQRPALPSLTRKKKSVKFVSFLETDRLVSTFTYQCSSPSRSTIAGALR
jgi:hypothetical protein